MKIKSIVFVSTFITSVFFIWYITNASLGLCDNFNIFLCDYSMDRIKAFFVFILIIFLFSLLTYKLPNRIFTYWWKFARLAIPAVFFLVILINLRLHHTPGGWMNLDNEIDLLMIYLIYGLFTLGSVIQIVRGFWSKNLLNRRGTLR